MTNLMFQNSLTLFCFVAVPIVTVLACWKWNVQIRLELSLWRNVLGLSAMGIVAVTWLFWVVLFVLALNPVATPSYLGQVWLSVFLYSGPAAALLAGALRGVSRAFMMAAGFLAWAGLRALGYN